MDRAGKMGAYSFAIKSELISQLATRNIQAVLTYYENNKETSSKFLADHIVKEIACNWSKNSPAEAWNWCISLENNNPSRSDIALCAFIEGLDAGDSTQIQSYIDRIYSKYGHVPNLAITHWASTNPEDAWAWVSAQQDKNNSYMQAALDGVSKKNLELAESLISKLPENKKDLVIPHIAENLTSTLGYKETLSWVIKQISLEKFDSSQFSLIGRWAKISPEEAKEWIYQLPDSPIREEAAISFARNMNNSHSYGETLELIEQLIKKPEIKEKELNARIRSWHKYSPDRLERWINSPDTPKKFKTLVKRTLNAHEN